jgi:hydroxypyruvate isomerase
MDRRGFLMSSVAAGVGAAVLGKMSTAAAAPEGPFSKLPIRMSVPIDFFEGTTDQKLEQVAKWGFPAYEWLGPEGDFDAIRKKADSLGLELSCMVGAGAIAPGGMVQPKDHDEIIKQFKERVEIAKRLNCKHLVGLSGNERKDVDRKTQTEAVVECLKKLAPIAEKNDVIIVMEALNTLVDHKGYFMSRTKHTMEILKAVNSPNVKMLFDIYHQQITEGNVIRNLTQNIDRIGHFHVADNPGRKEPGTGELNYTNIFKAIAGTGTKFKGFVALECGSSTKNNDDILKATRACFPA